MIVDGTARPGTVLTLSHWPASPTPRPLWRDLSTEIALAYLADPGPHERGATAAAIDHLDPDGLCSLLALVDPPAAWQRAPLLVEVARAGDFDVVTRRDAARIAFALRRLADPARSPLEGGERSGNGWLARCGSEAVAVLPALCDDPAAFAGWWEEEDAAYGASLAAFAAGAASVEERPGECLAVVRLERPWPGAAGRLEGGRRIGLHQAAVHGATASARVLLAEPARITYWDRYETWVRFVSRRLPPRVDLQPLARRLGDAEGPGGASWQADPPSHVQPVLGSEGASRLSEEEVVALLVAQLREAPPAWLPLEGGWPRGRLRRG